MKLAGISARGPNCKTPKTFGSQEKSKSDRRVGAPVPGEGRDNSSFARDHNAACDAYLIGLVRVVVLTEIKFGQLCRRQSQIEMSVLTR